MWCRRFSIAFMAGVLRGFSMIVSSFCFRLNLLPIFQFVMNDEIRDKIRSFCLMQTWLELLEPFACFCRLTA